MERPVTTFNIERPSFTRHYEISNERGVLYGDISKFTPKKPDLTLHNGSSDKGPVIGMVHFNHFSTEMTMGLGDPANSASVAWEALRRMGWTASAHEFHFTMPSGERKLFTWKRTKSQHIAGKSTTKMDRNNMKLVEGTDGRVIGLFTTNGIMSRSGTLQIFVAFGEHFDLFVLLAVLAIYEKNMRRKQSAGAASAGAS